MNPNQPVAEAVAMKDGRIVYVGSNKGAKQFIDDADDVIDLKGKYVTPGFLETHNHVVGSTWMTQGVDLSQAKSPEEIAQTLKEYADAHPDAKIIVGNGWIPAALTRLPTAADLDAIGINVPIIAIGNSCHDAVFNSLGLKLAGITEETPDIQPGIIYWAKDANGKKTGLAIEGQWAQAYVDLGAWQPETMIPEASDYLQGYLSTQGVTTTQVAGIMSPEAIISPEAVLNSFENTVMPILNERVENGKAPMRLSVMPIFKMIDADPKEYVDLVVKMGEKYNSDMLWTDTIKLHPELAWIDGGSTQFVPYVNTQPGEQANFGEYGIPPHIMYNLHATANAQGIKIITHSTGARGLRRLVDIFLELEELYPDSRNRLDHVDFITKYDQERIIKHDIPMNVTPAFTLDSDSGEAMFDTVDREYAKEVFGAYSDMAYEYKNISLSGDSPGFPIERAYPVYLMQQVLTLTDPNNKDSKHFPEWRKTMTYDQALYSYTVAPAWQLKKENDLGSIEVGKYADMAIFKNNLREVAENEPHNLIEKGTVVGTLLGGEFTHRKGM
ncbi:putative amidohydrolase [Paraferrimonas sedimenticola]|uniref:Amidohydrolase n=2 Tax=Paraferrimonas sedimenticola TaxID=375674 RepID=A0AA37VW06_9GAMM|nr:putative amidohydrolase [Paraferrimonas sedimenticola]